MNRQIDQWKKTESPKIDSHKYSQLIFVKGAKTIQWRKIAFQNSRWIKDINIRCDTIKVLEENIGKKNLNILHSNIFTDMSPRARDIKVRINKWDLIKIKSSYTAKGNSIKVKREPTVWENVFDNDTSDKGLISKYI